MQGLFERTGNVLKLVGDPYLARVYRLLDTRFHLDTWEKSIQRKLEVAEGVYQVVSDQAAAFRLEFLEIVVVLRRGSCPVCERKPIEALGRSTI